VSSSLILSEGIPDLDLFFACIIASHSHSTPSFRTRGIHIQTTLMARQKQAVPLQRATSSELMHLVPEGSESMSTQQNGSAQKPVTLNGSASTKGQAPEAPLETPGLIQLAICVLGIYASL
jgi:hypothetical protein